MLLLASQQFVPHGHCYLWQPRLVGLHVISDGLIALAYFSIPLGLLYFTRQRKDLPFVGIFLLFGAFIVCCGLTHLFAVWTLWHPNYWLSGTMKALTAAVSLYTGWQLIPLIPLALALKSPQELEAINQKLQAEIADRKLIEQNLRKSEQELKASKQFQKLLMDNIPQMIFWKDRECVYQGGNAHFLKAAGLNSSEDILGKQDWNLPWSDEEAVFYSECDRRVIASGEAEINTVENRYRADGSMIWSVTNKVPLFDERGEVMGILCTYQDITDQKQAEEAVRQSEAALRQRTVELEATLEKLETTQTRLIQSEKMSSLGQLVAGLAHEINNPVSFIHGNLGHVREYAQDLLNMIRLYQQYYPNPKEAIE
ncbi:MAG: PAS domain S-box protein, partial [Cyanobacteria bacterium P01_H01_bin.119]